MISTLAPRSRQNAASLSTAAASVPSGGVRMHQRPTKSSAKPASAEPATAFPKTWDDIDINCLVLAKEDGPWRSWWEAIPTDKSDHMFLLRWRDFPQVPAITRPRWALGLLYPNGR